MLISELSTAPEKSKSPTQIGAVTLVRKVPAPPTLAVLPMRMYQVLPAVTGHVTLLVVPPHESLLQAIEFAELVGHDAPGYTTRRVSKLASPHVVAVASPAMAAVNFIISSTHVQHVVFVTLANPSDAAAMKADSDAVFPKIPGVLNYACGPHIDVGRKNIRQDYTLGVLVEFATVDAYRAFQANPEHVALIKKWKPKWSKSEMFDFGAP